MNVINQSQPETNPAFLPPVLGKLAFTKLVSGAKKVGYC